MRRLTAGVDLGGTKIQTILLRDGQVVGSSRVRTPQTGADAVIAAITDSVKASIAAAGANTSQLAAAGIGSPGTIDGERGTVSHSPNVPGFETRSVPLGPEVSKALGGVEVKLDNDVRVAILGEWKRGAGRPFEDLLGVFVGTGVGGGVIMGGELRQGRGAAGEIGHTIVKEGGRRCSCGRRGHLEAYAGRACIEAAARSRLRRGRRTQLFDIMRSKQRDRVTSGVIAAALKRGDAVTVQLIDKAVWALGLALANAQNLLDTEAIIVGGGLGDRLGAPFVRRVEQAARPHLHVPERPPKFLTTELGDLSGAVGAAVLAGGCRTDDEAGLREGPPAGAQGWHPGAPRLLCRGATPQRHPSREGAASVGTTTGTELWGLGASELAAAIRERRVSSREAVLAHLARVEAVNPRVNAVTRVLGDEALAAADAADRRVADGDEVGPLHGVPFTVKENVDLAGSATTQGVAALVSAVPDVDAPHVGHLRAAGAIPIGRTNLPDFGLRWHTDNAVHGATRNPWDASLTPGGSSGGEAAALATGMTPLGVGNDLGGSLRWPAQCTGIVSIKPTLGRVPSATVIEPLDPPISIQLMAVQGPMARHVVDLRLALEVMSRPSARDPWHVPAPLTGEPLPAPVRVAIVSAPAGGDTSPQVAEGVGRAADALRAAGYEVEETEPPDVPAVAATWMSILAFDVRFLWQLMSPLASEDANRFMGIFMEMNPPVEPDAYVQALMARNALCRAWAEFQQTYPLIVAPISTQPPFPVGADLDADRVGAIANSMRMLVAANLLGVPAAAVPTGVGQGLPQVVEVIGPRFREDLCLAAAEAIQDACGIPTPIDPR